ncbi:MAG: autoinducer binding domain-containing protein, partial [Novosphingobium sp.]
MANRIRDCGRLDDLTRFAQECARAGNLGDLQGTIDAAVRELGFRWFTLLHNVDLRHGGGQRLFLTTYPPAWLEEVLEERHYIEDPIHAACARTPSGLAWDRVGDVLEL